MKFTLLSIFFLQLQVSYQTLPITSEKPLKIEEKSIINDPIFKRPPLYYYQLEKLSKLNNTMVPVKGPLQSHVENQHLLGLSRFLFQKKQNNLKKKLYFIIQDFNHKIQKNKNKAIERSNKLISIKIAASQRETGIKFQIDHDYAWKTYHSER